MKLCLTLLLALWPLLAFSQNDITAIADKNFKRADAILKKTYSHLIAMKLSKADFESLEKAQKTWLVYRDQQSQFVAGVLSGDSSAYTDEYLTSLTKMTLERTSELEKLTKTLDSQQVSK